MILLKTNETQYNRNAAYARACPNAGVFPTAPLAPVQKKPLNLISLLSARGPPIGLLLAYIQPKMNVIRCKKCGRPFGSVLNLARATPQSNPATLRTVVGAFVFSQKNSSDLPSTGTSCFRPATAAVSEVEEDPLGLPEPPAEEPAEEEQKEEQDTLNPPDDSSWKLFVVTRGFNRGGGLAGGDLQDLLNLLHSPDFDCSVISNCKYFVYCMWVQLDLRGSRPG
jgi:hypothetical protein